MDIGFSGIIPKQPVLPSASGPMSVQAAPSGNPPQLFDGEALSIREAPVRDPGRIREDAAGDIDEAGTLERKDTLGQLVSSVLDLAPPEMPRFI